jgi:hypothetical protein
MTPDWQAKAEAFTSAAWDVVAMVDRAAATSDLASKDALRLAHTTRRVVEAVEGLVSRLQQRDADQDFIGILRSLVETLKAADHRAAGLVSRVSTSARGAGPISVDGASARTTGRAPQRPWFRGRVGDFPGKLSLVGEGAYDLDVVVESFDQDALDALFGPRIDARTEHGAFCVGELLPESHSLYDPNAVGVYVSGLKVGHLSRDDAQHFRQAAAAAGIVGQSVDVHVLVTQGWRRQGEGEGPYRVRIDASVPFAFGARLRGAQIA